MDAGAEASLSALFESGQTASAEYASPKEALVPARAAKAAANLAAARQSVAELALAAKAAKLQEMDLAVHLCGEVLVG